MDINALNIKLCEILNDIICNYLSCDELKMCEKRENVKKIIEAGADVNFIDDNGHTPLCIISTPSKSDEEIIKMLLDNGANPDCTNCMYDKCKYQPLCNACLQGSTETVRNLVEHGATINYIDKYKASPIAYALDDFIYTDIIIYLFEKGAIVDEETYKYAFTYQGVEICLLLLKYINMNVNNVMKLQHIIKNTNEYLNKNKYKGIDNDDIKLINESITQILRNIEIYN